MREPTCSVPPLPALIQWRTEAWRGDKPFPAISCFWSKCCVGNRKMPQQEMNSEGLNENPHHCRGWHPAKLPWREEDHSNLMAALPNYHQVNDSINFLILVLKIWCKTWSWLPKAKALAGLYHVWPTTHFLPARIWWPMAPVFSIPLYDIGPRLSRGTFVTQLRPSGLPSQWEPPWLTRRAFNLPVWQWLCCLTCCRLSEFSPPLGRTRRGHRGRRTPSPLQPGTPAKGRHLQTLHLYL